MASFQSVLCAVDHGDLSRRVVHHAAGLAGAAQARLSLLYVSPRPPTPEDERALERLYLDVVPYGAAYVTDPVFRVETGPPAETILRVAEQNADLLVTGTRARSGLSRLLLGSTSAPLLEQTRTPVLLVPPDDIDIVTLGSTHVGLHFGAVIAAIDLDEHNREQLAMAGTLAALARQPLLLLSVAPATLTEHEAAKALRERARELEAPPHAFIVRRGDVAEEIGRAAVAERSGLVVMGLRRRDRGKPGKFATAVLRTGRAHVMAVPAS